MKIALVVEGHGDVFAVPALVRKVCADIGVFDSIEIPRPFRLSRGKMVKKDELMRAVELESRKADGGPVLVIFDADDDCPVLLAAMILGWFAARPDLDLHLVVANREMEDWFIASCDALGGVRGLQIGLVPPADPDQIRDGKGWLEARMLGPYSETLDQAAFAASISTDQALLSRSFRKFRKVIGQIVGAP